MCPWRMAMYNDAVDEGADKMTGYYRVADFVFAVTLERECDLDKILPSFVPFRCGEVQREDLLFELVEAELDEECQHAEFLDEDNNDMGQTRLYRVDGGYRITLRYTESCHVIEMAPDFRKISALLRWQDRYFPMALCSLLRIAFAQAVLKHSAVSMHSSVVLDSGHAVMFMGRSGTGKSTHSRLWIENIEGVSLLNDDNPIVRILDGKPVAYGSPWSGKTPCYKNAYVRVGGIVKLSQAPHNTLCPLTLPQAYAYILSSVSGLKMIPQMADDIYESIKYIITHVRCYHLDCLPNTDAAITCWNEIKGNSL